MFTQFFGNYLLNKELVSAEHLSEALQSMKDTRLKLGVLAINAGYMTAAQVETAHTEQQRVDKRIGDVMVEMGFLTREQIEELFNTQPSGHLLLGQALVDKGYMTNEQFESAINSYKTENSISDDDIANESDDTSRKFVDQFYKFSGEKNGYMVDYVSLLFKNIIRFIGDDFTPLNALPVGGPINNCIVQKTGGGLELVCAVQANDSAMAVFASRFAKEEITENDEYSQACVSEFINLHNGLFAVNMSNDKSTVVKLQPQYMCDELKKEEIDGGCIIPINFSFGTVNFVIKI